jgi:hypothetical protein
MVTNALGDEVVVVFAVVNADSGVVGADSHVLVRWREFDYRDFFGTSFLIPDTRQGFAPPLADLWVFEDQTFPIFAANNQLSTSVVVLDYFGLEFHMSMVYLLSGNNVPFSHQEVFTNCHKSCSLGVDR